MKERKDWRKKERKKKNKKEGEKIKKTKKEKNKQKKEKKNDSDKRKLKIINFRLNLVAHFGNKEKGGGRLNHLISKNSKNKNRSSKPSTLQST